MSLEDIAPTLFSLGFTQNQADNFFENKLQPPAPPAIPEITTQQAIAIGQALYVTGMAEAGGIAKLAHTVGLRIEQVKMIIAELKALEAEWWAAQNE
jgi:hypothetical protein